MNADELLRHYERIADAPDAVVRLRRFILDLAVRGKLVPQDPRDEPASELLKKMAAEKVGLVSGRKVNASATPSSFVSSVSELPCPSGWSIASLQAICTSITDGDHLPPPKSEAGIPFLVIGNVREQRIDFTGCRHVAREYYEKLDPIRRPRTGDLLYTLVGSYGIPVVVSDDRPFCVQRHIGILRPSKLLVLRFLARVLESQVAFDQATACATGIAQKTVSLSGLRRMAIPLPPLAEQHRIVAKVDELMTLCDRLEAARAQREAARDRLARSCLTRLDTPEPETFHEDARFALDTLPALTARADQIKPLRQTILNLAVRGRLVPQDPADEPAAELLVRIAGERAKPIGAPPNRQQARPAELRSGLPHGWVSARFEQILLELQTGPFGSSLHQSDYVVGGTPVINPASIQGERIVPIDKMAVGAATLERLATFKFRAGDVVLGRRGEMGRSAVVTESEQGWLCGTGSLILRLSRQVCARFVVLLLGSPSVRDYLGGKAVGATMQNLNQGILLNLVIGVPPSAEQHRIVAKVDELMVLCDRLEASLQQADEHRRRLLETLLHEALEPAAVLEEPVA